MNLRRSPARPSPPRVASLPIGGVPKRRRISPANAWEPSVMTSAARTRVRFVLLVLTTAATIAATPLVSADHDGYRPAAYAIQGARIVAAPDSTIEAGTVVVREGRIESVGPADKV